MPRMDGAELYARLQQERPVLAERVLFLSGDITQLAGRGLAPVSRERVLVKPVELAELEQRIQEFMREAAGGRSSSRAFSRPSRSGSASSPCVATYSIRPVR